MKGAWKVTSNIVDYRTRKMRYSCVRVIDMSQPGTVAIVRNCASGIQVRRRLRLWQKP